MKRRKPQTANRKPQTANRKPQTANRKPQTANRKPQTANRKPRRPARSLATSPPEPRRGRIRARLFRLLPVLALLLGALGLFAAAPAQAQPTTPIWSATLTVKGPLEDVDVGCSNTVTGKECSSASVLTDDDFTLSGTSWEITDISALATELLVGFNRNARTALDSYSFCVGTTALAFSSATHIDDESATFATTAASGWSAGNTVSLSIGTSCAQVSTPPGIPFTGTMTVGDGGSWKGFQASSNTGALDKADFTAAGVSYRILSLQLTNSGGWLDLQLDKALPRGLGLVLNVGTSRFKLADAVLLTGPGFEGVIASWAYANQGETPPSWSVGDTPAVSLGASVSSTVKLAVRPTPVKEGSWVSVEACLSVLPKGRTRIPVVLSHGTSEAGDWGVSWSGNTDGSLPVRTAESIVIDDWFQSRCGVVNIPTHWDDDTDDETFHGGAGEQPAAGGGGGHAVHGRGHDSRPGGERQAARS